MSTRIIKFETEKGYRAPKERNKENTVYVIFSPEGVTIYLGQTKFIHTKFSVKHPDDILTTFVIMPDLKKEGLKLIGQVYHTNQRVRLEYFNPTLNTFTIKKI